MPIPLMRLQLILSYKAHCAIILASRSPAVEPRCLRVVRRGVADHVARAAEGVAAVRAGVAGLRVGDRVERVERCIG